MTDKNLLQLSPTHMDLAVQAILPLLVDILLQWKNQENIIEILKNSYYNFKKKNEVLYLMYKHFFHYYYCALRYR